MFLINCDCSIQPFNPGGILAWAFIVKMNKKIVHQDCGTCGRKLNVHDRTNNVGEYYAVMAVMKWLMSVPTKDQRPVIVKSDSELIVNQLKGLWECNDPKLKPLRNLVLKSKKRYTKMIKFHWIPREKNKEVDALSRTAYDEEELQYFKDNQVDIIFEGDDLQF
jgi:ribonuclease HI